MARRDRLPDSLLFDPGELRPVGRRRSSARASLTRGTLDAMRSAYRSRYATPLLVSWTREMAMVSRKLRECEEAASALGVSARDLVVEAWLEYLGDARFSRDGHPIRLFWARFQTFLVRASDRLRGIRYAQLRPDMALDQSPPPVRKPRWIKE
jgi:hypothetical protein